MRKLQLAIMAACLAGAMGAQASIISLGAPYPTQSWNSGQFHDPESFNYNHMEGIIVAGPVFEVPPGMTGLSPGWANVYGTSTRVAATGGSSTDAYVAWNFVDPLSYGSVFDWNVYDGATAKASYRMYLAGTGVTVPDGAIGAGYGWYYLDRGADNAPAPVPEPTTMIAGALLLLPFGASTLRKLRRNRVA